MVTSRTSRSLSARLVVAGALLVAGCTVPGVPMAPSSVPPGTPLPPQSTPGTPSAWPSGRPPLQTASPSQPGVPAELSQARWQAILDDLAGRGVAGTPEVVSVAAVTWPDSSLGCPSPGVSYTQALVDGVRVVVSVDGTEYDYRFGTGSTPKLCTSGR